MMFDCLSDWFINYLTQNGFWKGKELSNVIWNERRYVLKNFWFVFWYQTGKKKYSQMLDFEQNF